MAHCVDVQFVGFPGSLGAMHSNRFLRLASLLLVTACGGAPAAAPQAAVPASVRTTPPPAPEAPRLQVHAAPDTSRLQPVDAEHWFSGGIRASGSGASLAIAEHAFSMPLAFVTRAASSFVFHLTNGEIWRGEAYLARPSYVGTFPRELPPVSTTDATYFVTVDGTLMRVGSTGSAQAVDALADYVLRNVVISADELYVQEAGDLWLRRGAQGWERTQEPAPATPPALPEFDHIARILDLLRQRMPLGVAAGLSLNEAGHLIGRGLHIAADSVRTFDEVPEPPNVAQYWLMDTGRGFLAIGMNNDPEVAVNTYLIDAAQGEWERLPEIDGRRLTPRGREASLDGESMVWLCGEGDICRFDLEAKQISFVPIQSGLFGELVHQGDAAYHHGYGTPGVLRIALQDGTRSLVDVPTPEHGRVWLTATPEGFIAQNIGDADEPGAAHRYDGSTVQALELPGQCRLLAPIGAPWLLCVGTETLHVSGDTGQNWHPLTLPENASLQSTRMFGGAPACRYSACRVGSVVVAPEGLIEELGTFSLLPAQAPPTAAPTPWEVAGLECMYHSQPTRIDRGRAVALDARMHFRDAERSIRWNVALPAGDTPWESDLTYRVFALTNTLALFRFRGFSPIAHTLPRTHLAHRRGIVPFEVWGAWWRAERSGDLSLLDSSGYRRIDNRGQVHEDLGQRVTAVATNDGALLRAVPAGNLRWALVGPGDQRRVVQLSEAALGLCNEEDEDAELLIARDLNGYGRTVTFRLSATPCVREITTDERRLTARGGEWFFEDGTKCEVPQQP
ncbi:MAG: hypothetical protein AAF938_09870 [Myxococcota bacterium]